jgi:hypothetical protein
MGIRVRHEAPIAVSGQFAQQIGTNQGIGAAAAAEQARAEFLLGLDLKNRAFEQDANQFAVNTALRVNEQDQQQQRWRTQLAVTDATQQRQAYDNEANRAARLAERQMAEEYGLLGQQQQEYGQWMQEQSKTLDQQVDDRLKEFRNLKLSPEGQRILNEYSGKRRQIQGELLRPEAKQQALGSLMADLESAGLDSYAEHVPTAAEEVYEGLVPLQGQQVVPGQPLPPGKYRSVKGVRNGVKQYETLDIPPEETLTTADRFKRDMTPTPDGGFAVYNQETKKWDVHAPQAKAAEKPAAPLLPAADRDQFFKSIENSLKADWETDHVKDIPGEPAVIVDGEIKTAAKPARREIDMPFDEYYEKNWKKKVARFNQMFGDPDEETLVPSELQPQGSTLGANIDAPLSIDMGGSPTDFGETNPGMVGGDEPIQVTSRAEAEAVEIGKTFVKDGVLWLKTGPGQAEPVGNGVP